MVEIVLGDRGRDPGEVPIFILFLFTPNFYMNRLTKNTNSCV